MNDLIRLAAARGVDSSYVDHWGHTKTVSSDTLVAVLRALGEPLSNAGDAGDCLRRLATDRPPVLVAWDGELRLSPGEELEVVRLEDGTQLSDPPGRLPFGVHSLRRLGDGDAGDSAVMVISAPRQARSLGDGWALFAPVYALRDERRRLTGDFTSLQRLCELAGRLGASYVSTLPVLAGFSTADDPAMVAGPYSPLSRMWWNEAYLDADQIPELAGLTLAADYERPGEAGDPWAGKAEVALAGGSMRPVLETGLQVLRRGGGRRLRDFEIFCRESPDLRLYGLFRAAVETCGLPPERWPASYRPSTLQAGADVDAEAADAHMYAQWLCEEQLSGVAEKAAAHRCGLMLDLPVGCRPDGFDPWAYPGSFAGVVDGYGVSVGAPPDRFFQAGQNWGFRPLSPEGERRAGYPVLRACLSRLMRHCRALRIDHVMGLQRLWWIPSGAPAAQGAYVHYHFEEILALTCLEAWRNDVAIAGEDLGTVDSQVRRKLQEHAIAGMHVAVFDIAARPDQPLQPRAGSMALVDTHDTATFAGWLEATDIDVRWRLGFLDDDEATAARTDRRAARRRLTHRLVGAGLLDPASVDRPAEIHAGVLEELGRSAAGLVGVNIEDLWAETSPQNIPGTDTEHANFSQRLAFTLAEIEASPTITEPLRRLDRARRQVGDEPTTKTTSR